MFAEADLSDDLFLGGRLGICQPRRGYRAGIDPVLLAAAVPARPGQTVLELGLGAGTASLCLAARVPGLRLSGVELLPAYAELARRNAARAGVALDVVEGDVGALPAPLRACRFDHVLMNPPYFAASGRTAAPDPGREAGRGESLPLSAWVDTAARRLAPGGTLTVIQRVERLPELIASAAALLGSLELMPVAPRQGQAAGLAILRARKGGRAGFQLHAPFVLHEGTRHERDGESYGAAAQAILRGGGGLDFGGAA